MLKVLIVDDEIRVCRLIQYLIDWESLGFEMLGYVNDGLSAFQIIQEKNPDIVITDIRMPEFGGLELIQQTRNISYNTHFIIISGYSDFSYAQTAIKYGVDDYLLKPIKKKELIQTLDKIKSELDLVKKNIIQTENMRRMLDQSGRKVKSKLLSDMFEAGMAFQYHVQSINDTYFCNFIEGLYQMIGLQIHLNPIPNTQTIGFLNSKVQDAISETFSSYHEVVFTYSCGTMYCLINGTDEEFSSLKTDLQKLRTLILSFKDVFDGIRPIIALSERMSEINTVPILKQQVEYVLMNKLFYNIDTPLMYKPHPEVPSIDHVLGNSFRKDFMIYVETLDFYNLSNLLKTIQETLKHTSPIDGKYVLDIYHEIVSLFLFSVKSNSINLDLKTIEEDFNENFNRFTSIDECFQYLNDRLINYLSEWQNEKALAHSKPIRQAKQYINEHYKEPLTLEIIGSFIGLNPTYFSSVFKKETGASFIDYLTEVRVQNSKNLLVNTSISVYDVAEQCGFNDMKYFNKKFKKYTGLSPSEYRKLYS
jgi:two-component system response regulator YesN